MDSILQTSTIKLDILSPYILLYHFFKICKLFYVMFKMLFLLMIISNLELPMNQIVYSDEGFISLQAKCNEEIEWLVISKNRVKYLTVPAAKTIIFSIPPVESDITILANGKSSFAVTNIKIISRIPKKSKKDVVFLVKNLTPEVAKILVSENLRTVIISKNYNFKVEEIGFSVLAIQNNIKENSVIIINNNTVLAKMILTEDICGKITLLLQREK